MSCKLTAYCCLSACLPLGPHPTPVSLQEMKIENIDTTLEEIQEVGEQMRVINEAISQPVGGFQDLEMDDLEAELAELEAEELDNQVSILGVMFVCNLKDTLLDVQNQLGNSNCIIMEHVL